MSEATIPDAALPVVEAIRSEVRRPEDTPRPVFQDGTWLRFDRDGIRCCPMSFLRAAKSACPSCVNHFRGRPFAFEQIKAYILWWDIFSDAELAMYQQWPRRSK